MGQKPPKKVKWDKAESFQPLIFNNVFTRDPVYMSTCNFGLKKGFSLGLGKFSDCQGCATKVTGVFIFDTWSKYTMFSVCIELICHSGLRE